MAPVPSPVQIAQDAVYCGALGAALGAARAWLPAKGKAAFLPDLMLTGALILLLQSYAAAFSAAGTLRWYMALGGALGALAAQGALTVPVGVVRLMVRRLAALPTRFFIQKALRPALERQAERRARVKALRDEKISSKMHKKRLQKEQHLLYNSNI